MVHILTSLEIKILSLEICSQGQSGIIFIELPEGSFIVKAAADIPNEIFYNRIAEQMGIRVPQMSFFTIEDTLYLKLMEAFAIYCGDED